MTVPIVTLLLLNDPLPNSFLDSFHGFHPTRFHPQLKPCGSVQEIVGGDEGPSVMTHWGVDSLDPSR